MIIRDAFLKVLAEYRSATSAPIANHSLAEFIRTEFPATLEPLLPSAARYSIKSSAGQGQWGRVPWVATFDTLVTTTAQTGYYITYLFKSDMSGVYLNLNQGVTDVQRRYKIKAKDVLHIRATDFKAQLGSLTEPYQTGMIDLGGDLPPTVALYNYGSICSKFYSKDAFPSDEELVRDYAAFLNLYAFLVDNDNTSASEEIPVRVISGEPEILFEDTRRRRKHERIERNQRLAQAAKEVHGYRCQVCGFDFKKVYGDLGHEYIEAHHLIPLAALVDTRIALDPKTDFAVLCANCHRMVHRLEGPSALDALRHLLIKRPAT